MKRFLLLALGLLALGTPAVNALDGGSGPNVGKDAPELQTKEWINSEGLTALADMKGQVVLIASWKTG
jgi:hypothetical protein